MNKRILVATVLSAMFVLQATAASISVFKIYRPSCPVCQQVAPEWDKVKQTLGISYKPGRTYTFSEINLDTDTAEASRFSGIRGVPTFIVLRDGKEVGRTGGYKSASSLESFIKSSAGE